jgi:hypothetical protein
MTFAKYFQNVVSGESYRQKIGQKSNTITKASLKEARTKSKEE